MANIDSANPNSGFKAPEVKISDKAPSLHQVSLLGVKQKKGPKKILKRIVLTIIVLLILLGGTVILRASNLSQKIFVGQKTTFFGKIMDIIRGTGGQQQLIGEDLGQINILLLGIGGEGHDGPYLTDSILLAQIRPDLGQITLISIPRDYWVDLPNGGQSKINEAFSDGYLKNHDWNEGGSWTRQVVENLTGQKIPYFAVMDFSGFEKAINQVGGVDVTVDRDFTDYQYPDSGTGYLPPQTFIAGPQHMDGARALIFARSRHAAGLEGSDFARSSRQQKIIQGFKEKVLSLNLISDATKLNALLDTFADHFHTNLSPAEILHIYNLNKERYVSDFVSLSFDPSTSIVCPVIRQDTGAYTLAPCPGKTDTDVKNFFKNASSFGKMEAEKTIVWLSSSTGDRAAYTSAESQLKEVGLKVFELPYKGEQLSQTVFYQANPKPATATFIKNTLNATEAQIPPPGINVDKSRVDVIIILGSN